MPGFQRRAKWLNAIFPASESPALQDPGDRSPDVSLVQPYDGSGWAFQGLNSWAKASGLIGGASGFFVLQEVGPEEVFRILEVSMIVTVNATANVSLSIIDNEGGGSQAFIGDEIAPALLRPTNFNVRTPIIGPGGRLRVEWTGAGATYEMNVLLYGALAPLGTIFYI